MLERAKCLKPQYVFHSVVAQATRPFGANQAIGSGLGGCACRSGVREINRAESSDVPNAGSRVSLADNAAVQKTSTGDCSRDNRSGRVQADLRCDYVGRNFVEKSGRAE